MARFVHSCHRRMCRAISSGSVIHPFVHFAHGVLVVPRQKYDWNWILDVVVEIAELLRREEGGGPGMLYGIWDTY